MCAHLLYHHLVLVHTPFKLSLKHTRKLRIATTCGLVRELYAYHYQLSLLQMFTLPTDVWMTFVCRVWFPNKNIRRQSHLLWFICATSQSVIFKIKIGYVNIIRYAIFNLVVTISLQVKYKSLLFSSSSMSTTKQSHASGPGRPKTKIEINLLDPKESLETF